MYEVSLRVLRSVFLLMVFPLFLSCATNIVERTYYADGKIKEEISKMYPHGSVFSNKYVLQGPYIVD